MSDNKNIFVWTSNLPDTVVRASICAVPWPNRACLMMKAWTGAITAQGPPSNWTSAAEDASLKINPE